MFPLILIISVFSVYINTVSPSVYSGDSGELTAAAFSLGIPHNSGYPIYSLLGKLFCLIPIGNIGFRMNIMSASFAAFTVWLVYSFILKITSSKVGAFTGALILAFTSVFWSQTVSAEVYTLHVFFVALLIRILWWWDERREFALLILFAFITGLSFGNHLQTVMLAPAVLFVVLSADKNALINGKHFLLLSVFFMLALAVYVYLPIRTDAGAAIHWGDPNNLERFLAHVTGRSHREHYVLNRSPLEYLSRTKETLWFVGSQFGALLLLALWGWLKLASARWRIFFVLVIVFDFVYTIFLNFISLEITAFTLPTCVVLVILAGIGVDQALKAFGSIKYVGAGTQKLIRGACCMVPAISLFFNYASNDQSRNYTAYEQAVNIFRTTSKGDILFMNGDNYVFPVIYGRVVEKMREDIRLYDRNNIFFNWLKADKDVFRDRSAFEDFRNSTEQKIIKERGNRNVFYAVFGPYAIKLPDQYIMLNYGVLHRVVHKDHLIRNYQVSNVWNYYSSESFYEEFQRDFMTRELCAYYHFDRGIYLFLSGQPSYSIKNLKLASIVGYDDTLIHMDMAIFLIDEGFFEEARQELEKALVFHEDLSKVYNNWGYYYHKIGRYGAAIVSLRKAIDLSPNDFGCYNNLGYAFFKAGRNQDAFLTFKQSLAINGDQPEIVKFMEKNGLKDGVVN